MLTPGVPGTGIPPNMSQRSLGVMDHLSIGQDSVDTGYATLKNAGRLENVRNDGHTQIGKDGKGQFNLYDPDGIRLELMNWHATQEAMLLGVYSAGPIALEIAMPHRAR